jgi:hypothetical protein
MISKPKQFEGLFAKKVTPLICILGLIGLSFFARYVWMNHQQKEFLKTTQHLLEYIETTISKDQKVFNSEIQNILKSNPRIALFAWDNHLEKREVGFLNVKSFDLGASRIADYYNQHTTDEVLQQIIQNPQEFSGAFLQIEEHPVFRNMSGQKVKAGQFTIGFILPGFLPQTPESGSYYDSYYKSWILFLVTNVVFYPLYLRRRKKYSKISNFPKMEKDRLEWLEKQLNTEGFEEDTARDSEFVQQKPGWTELFNQSDLKDWNVKGEWYTREQCAIGFPWGGSITTKYDIPFDRYEFEVEAMRMVGGEGFALLFQSQGKQLVWMVGGWKNTRSEVIGFENTKTNDVLDKFRWYYMKIESEAEKLVGFLDGRKIWEIQKKDLVESSVDLGFQRGFGVGVWASMARFQRIRIISTE